MGLWQELLKGRQEGREMTYLKVYRFCYRHSCMFGLVVSVHPITTKFYQRSTERPTQITVNLEEAIHKQVKTKILHS